MRPLQRLADRLPPWLGSIRFRLTAIYSLLLFGLAALVVGGIYALAASGLDEQRVWRTYTVDRPVVTPEGIELQQEVIREELQTLEQLVNRRALEELRQYSLFALSVLFLGSLGVGWIVAGRVLAPIGRITAVARDIEATDLSRRIALGGPNDELRDLADTFDGMLDRIEEAFESQRRFIQEASHELRNPLAVMRTNLDVTLSDPDASAEDLRQTATVVARTAERMTKLVADLLAHARQGLPSSERELVALEALVHEAVEEQRTPAELRSLHLQAVTMPGTVVLGDRTALRQALTNLIGNAVRLAPEGSAITVCSGREQAWAFLSVSDQGPGIALQDQARVFERFWRAPGQPAGPDGALGSGLGLTIVRDTVARHGGQVAVASTVGVGSTFVLWLPPAADGGAVEVAPTTGEHPRTVAGAFLQRKRTPATNLADSGEVAVVAPPAPPRGGPGVLRSRRRLGAPSLGGPASGEVPAVPATPPVGPAAADPADPAGARPAGPHPSSEG